MEKDGINELKGFCYFFLWILFSFLFLYCEILLFKVVVLLNSFVKVLDVLRC